MKKPSIAIIIFFTFCISACTPNPIDLEPENLFGPLPKEVNHPTDNSPSMEKMLLGKKLFWDPILSGNKDIACVSCHHPKDGYAEQLDLSIGVGGAGLSENRMNGVQVKRNSPSILNTAYNGINSEGVFNPEEAPMFWDNRINSLEAQALQPILSAEEMRGTEILESAIMDTILLRLQNIPAYVSMFEEAFGDSEISEENLGKAIASFERSLTANNSRFDQYINGDKSALSSIEVRGMINFSEVGCVNCHNGPMFSDFELHVLTVPENDKLVEADKGDGSFAFRTPSLRNLVQTAPYMHNGVFASLEEVLEFYDDADDESQNSHVPSQQRDQKLEQLNIPDDKVASIIAFLKALDDDNFDNETLTEVPSKLPPGGAIN